MTMASVVSLFGTRIAVAVLDGGDDIARRGICIFAASALDSSTFSSTFLRAFESPFVKMS